MTKKIVFLALHLSYGGTERAIISEANMLVKRYEVEIISFYHLCDKPAFEVDPRVKITYLTEGLKPNRDEIKNAIKSKRPLQLIKECSKSIRILYLRTASMKKAIKKSNGDVLISTRYLYHKLLTENAKDGVVCIAQEHNHHNNNEEYIKKQIESVKQMDYFMPVSQELTDFYADRLSETTVKCRYIPHSLNYIPEKVSDLRGKSIISVGRLSPEKNYEELINVFKQLCAEDTEWTLNIVGDGVEKEQLNSLIEEYHLKNRVVLHGFRDKKYIEKLMYQSSIYVMTSLTESFGLVLIEAQSYGLPCIAYDCAQGAKEIIEDGVNGILIRDYSRERMVNECQKMMQEYEYRKKIGENGRKSVNKYSCECVEKQWFEFIDNI